METKRGQKKRGGEGRAVCHEKGRGERKISERTIHGP